MRGLCCVINAIVLISLQKNIDNIQFNLLLNFSSFESAGHSADTIPVQDVSIWNLNKKNDKDAAKHRKKRAIASIMKAFPQQFYQSSSL